MQQWQQLTDQQKKLAIALIVVIVLAVILIVWQLMPKQTSTPTTEVTQQPISPSPVSPAPGTGVPSTGQIGAPGFETSPEMAGQVGGPTLAGVPAAPGQTLGAPTAPEAGVTALPPAGKLENPPKPGRQDPFADLPPKSTGVAPFNPIVLPPTPEPVIVAKSPAGSIGTETFSTQDIATNIPSLQGQPVDLRSYFSPPQAIVARRELVGWRLAGTIMTEGSVGAIIQTPDGRTRPVRLGDRIAYGGFDLTVTRVEDQQVFFKDEKGDEYFLTRRPSGVRTVPPYGGAVMPGGFGPGGFAPGGFGPGFGGY
ncbi:MAG: hypothetical protein NZ805_10000 [Armatimonadetes bacterium]|nr:hypothetical protein [Armatimonadota bacterium]